MRIGFAALVLLALAGCGGRAEVAGCVPTETLVELDGDVVVMANDCGDSAIRPATPADLARLEAPL